MESQRVAPDHRGLPRPGPAHPRTALPTGSLARWTRHDHASACIVRLRGRQGSPAWSCAPGWPGPATGRHQLLARGDQIPDSPDRFRRGPAAHRGRRRGRAAGVWPQHRRRPRHGGRRGTQRSGRRAGNVGRGTGVFAAAARDHGPVSIPGDTGPSPAVPGCEAPGVRHESLPVCGQVPARLPARALEASPLLSLELRVPQARAADTCWASPQAGTGGQIRRQTFRCPAPGGSGAAVVIGYLRGRGDPGGWASCGSQRLNGKPR
jgi:hypothetical protein